MKRSVAIIGSGPAALMLAAQLSEEKFEVTIYERNFAAGRKFLVAGDGGLNLTHAEPIDQFIERYTPASFFKNLITSFSNNDLRVWLATIGIPTFIGSSKRVFPVAPTKPITVLSAILKLLNAKKVHIKTNHLWQGWENEQLIFTTKEGSKLTVKADVVVFALGGCSWKKTGSDGGWLPQFSAKGIITVPFQPSNCAVKIEWPTAISDMLEGKSLKNISIASLGKEKKGEVVITAFGLEGGPIYALSPQIREQLRENQTATIYLDLKPALTEAQISKRLNEHKGNKSITKHIEDQLKLSKIQLILLKAFSTKEEFINTTFLATQIKKLPLQIKAIAPIDEAISTVGGVALKEIDANFQLKKLPGTYVIGEMLDWDAPTGGYLLQACFSMGHKVAQHLNGA